MGEFLATVLGLLKWKILTSNLHGKGKGASYRLREGVTELAGVYGQPLDDGQSQAAFFSVPSMIKGR
jgi:hypothetical protein